MGNEARFARLWGHPSPHRTLSWVQHQGAPKTEESCPPPRESPWDSGTSLKLLVQLG